MARSAALVGAAIGVLGILAGVLLVNTHSCTTLSPLGGCTQPFLLVGEVVLVAGTLLCLLGMGLYARGRKRDLVEGGSERR